MGRNECGQRAAARILARVRGGDWRDHAARLAATHPPDTPWRLLGTTPAQLARMLAANDVPAVALRRVEEAALAPGAAACVDLRHLVGGLPRLHWDLVEDVRADAIRFGGRWYPRASFLRAWQCRCSPFAMHRRALVLARA